MKIKFDKNRTISLNNITPVSENDFRKSLIDAVHDGLRFKAMFAVEEELKLFAILADDINDEFYLVLTKLEKKEYQSLTPEIPQAHLFEREIYEETAIKPINHPWLKPVRFPQNSKRKIGDIDFFKVEGDDIHQVAVGPVHAGIIEPGHFRFQCHGETVYHLEISLGYQHRGVEKNLINGPHKNTKYLMETVSGDTTIAHTTSYANIIEQLANIAISRTSQIIRAISLELERCANHIGDLGALAGDVGYLPTMSYCGRIRGDFLNMTGLICGNRLGRGIVKPGGVGFEFDKSLQDELRKKILVGKADFMNAVSLLWETPSVLSFFEDTGIVSAETAKNLGLVGVAGRASGINLDSRVAHSTGIYKELDIKVPSYEKGDVYCRAKVRWDEVLESINIILDLLDKFEDEKPAKFADFKLDANMISIAINEGWRGEVAHIAITDNAGKFSKYKIIDPSFHNWSGLAMSLRDEQIANFPVCNKSFSLSYCGFDL